MSPVQAYVRNVGTSRLDVKGDIQVDGPTRMRVPMRGGGTDGLVVAMKPVNAGGAKEPALSGFGDPSLLADLDNGHYFPAAELI